MSILNKIFGGQQQQPAQQQPQVPPSVNANQTVPNATNTPPPATPTNGEPSASPLDNYKDLWQTSAKQGEGDNEFKFDRTKLGEISNQMDFTNGVTPDQLAAIAAGGEDAIKAFSSVLNTVSRAAYMNSTETAAHLIHNALGAAKTDITGKIPDMIKKATVSSKLRSENPLFSNPAVAPILSAVEAQIASKYPDASAEEITSHAKRYLESFAGAILPPAVPAADPSADNSGSDFSGWA